MKKLLMAAGAAIALGAPGLAHAETACADLKQTALPHAEILSATQEKAGNLDACKLSIASHPTKDSDIRIEVWIPVGAAWNGKFVQVGNGGFAGSISSPQLRRVAGQGYAVAGTDDGHQATATNAAWALNHPEKVVDFGWRALKETTDLSKRMIAAQKGAGGLKKSYFTGCSDGGREALMEAQRFPNDFDGIVAGAPANYMSLLFGNGAAQQQALSKPGGYLDKPQLELLQAAARKQCGGEGFIRDPASCRFDPAALQCKPGQADGCLTAPQVASAKAIYDGRRDPRTGKAVLPGLSPGAEAEQGGWQAWITGPTQARNGEAAGYQFSSNAFKYFAFNDANYDFLKMDLGAEFDRAKAKMTPVIDSESPNLAAFKKRGGKLIQYHGWNDPAIPAHSSIRYYEDVGRTMGETTGFYRLYLVPGMLHCGGGPGPGNVDWLAKLDAWVTAGEPPKDVTATGAAGASQMLCPYPGVARKSGEAWACAVSGRKS